MYASISVLYIPQGNPVNPSAGFYKVLYISFVMPLLSVRGRSTVKTLCFVHVLCLLQFGVQARKGTYSAMAEHVQRKLPHQGLASGPAFHSRPEWWHWGLCTLLRPHVVATQYIKRDRNSLSDSKICWVGLTHQLAGGFKERLKDVIPVFSIKQIKMFLLHWNTQSILEFSFILPQHL